MIYRPYRSAEPFEKTLSSLDEVGVFPPENITEFIGTLDDGSREMGIILKNCLKRSLATVEQGETLNFWFTRVEIQNNTDLSVLLISQESNQVTALRMGRASKYYEGTRINKLILAKSHEARGHIMNQLTEFDVNDTDGIIEGLKTTFAAFVPPS